MKDRIFTVLFIVALTVFILTVSIGLPIYCRFFYYIHINALGMPAKTGWSYETIKEAYDEVLNYLTLPGRAFGTGSLKWSESGAAHFADCKVLFDINLGGILCSSAILMVIAALSKLKKIALKRPFGHSACAVAAILAVLLPSAVGIVAAIDFDAAFSAFHSVFFPGKTNWYFDPETDEIILVMPERFFMNCAILIGAAIIVFAAALIVYDARTFNSEKSRR